MKRKGVLLKQAQVGTFLHGPNQFVSACEIFPSYQYATVDPRGDVSIKR